MSWRLWYLLSVMALFLIVLILMICRGKIGGRSVFRCLIAQEEEPSLLTVTQDEPLNKPEASLGLNSLKKTS